jgi:enterochelin esterase-like enzyme
MNALVLTFVSILKHDYTFGVHMIKEKYYSTTTNVDRFCNVYLPDNYTLKRKYNVLYVLHGVGGTEDEWLENGSPIEIMSQLYKDNLVEPMIIVFPNGRAMNPDSVPQDVFGQVYQLAFERFEDDLLHDLIPFIETKYSVYGDRAHRGICGLSQGGGQSLNFGLSHPELFSCVGAFAPAPNTDISKFKIESNIKEPIIYLLCGESDDLLFVSEQVNGFLSSQGIPHVYKTMQGDHEWFVWKEGLKSFVQMIFR